MKNKVALSSLIIFVVALFSVPAIASTNCNHPCVWLDSTHQALLASKVTSNDSTWLALKSHADTLLTYTVAPFAATGCASNNICYSYEGGNWSDAVLTLALAYKATGNSAYAAKVGNIVDVMNAAGQVPITVDSGYPSRFILPAAAIAFDWCYNELSSAQKSALITTANSWYTWITTTAYARTGPAYNNYFSGHIEGIGLWGLASSPDNPLAATIQTWASDAWTNYVAAAFGSTNGSPNGFLGGTSPESYNYGGNGLVREFLYAYAVKTATGSYPANAVAYAQAVAKGTVWNQKPSLWAATDEGDWPGNLAGVMYASTPLYFADFLAGTTEGQWMQWMYGNIPEVPGGYCLAATVLFDAAMWYDPRRTATPPFALPTSYYSAGDGHAFVRSDWTTSATWASFLDTGSYWTSHQQKGAGHIALSRGSDYLLVNSGQWHGAAGYAGTPQSFDSHQSWRTNTLFFDDHGTYMYTGTSYIGGQGTWGGYAPVFSDSQPYYVVDRADLTGAYDKQLSDRNATLRSLRYFYRTFAALDANKYQVIFDRVLALDASYTKKLYWHINPSGGAPTVSGSTVTSGKIGASKLTIHTLLPASPVIAVEADGRTSYTDTAMITYRESVSDSATSTALTGLTVLMATDSAAAPPAATLITSSGNTMYGALIADATAPRVVMFSADGTTRASVTYQAGYDPGLLGRHLICDLTPSTTFTVSRDGNVLGTITSTAAAAGGCIEFPSTGGTSYSIATGGTAPSSPPTAPSSPAISNTSLASGTQGVPYVQTLSATGGTSPYQWSVISGALPHLLTLDISTGTISGTPDTAGLSDFTIAVADASGQTSSKAMSITIVAASDPTAPVVAPLVIQTASTLPAAVKGLAYGYTLTATGGTLPYRWSITSGSLPNGLTLDPATGMISGTPTKNGNSTFTVSVSDAAGAVNSSAFSLSVGSGKNMSVKPYRVKASLYLPGEYGPEDGREADAQIARFRRPVAA